MELADINFSDFKLCKCQGPGVQGETAALALKRDLHVACVYHT